MLVKGATGVKHAHISKTFSVRYWQIMSLVSHDSRLGSFKKFANYMADVFSVTPGTSQRICATQKHKDYVPLNYTYFIKDVSHINNYQSRLQN